MASDKSPWVGRRHVAVLAPCGGAAGLFPHMRAQGVARLSALTGLPVRLMPTALLFTQLAVVLAAGGRHTARLDVDGAALRAARRRFGGWCAPRSTP